MSFAIVYEGTTDDSTIVRNHLVGNGIQAALCKRSYDAFAPIYHHGMGMMPVTVIVPSEQEASAVSLIQLFVKRNHEENWCCPKCGEDIPGQFSGCWKCGEIHPHGQGG